MRKTLKFVLLALIIVVGLAILGAITHSEREKLADPTPKPAETRQMVLIGQWGVIGRTSVACRSLDDAEKVWSLARNDQVAARRYAAEKCGEMSSGMEVSVDDASIWHDAACVRLRGDTACWWVARDAVTNKAEPR